MRAGRVAGVQLVLNNWFLAMIALFSLAGLAGKVLLVFAAVLWHEVGHAITAALLGLKVREIELLPFGGVARIDGLYSAGNHKEAIIAAAGPLSSLVLAALASPGLQSSVWSEQTRFFIEVNVTLAVFNMLPALLLDGGRIVRAWLAAFVSYEQATMLMSVTTKTITVLAIVYIGLQFAVNGTLHITLAVAAVFLYVAAQRELGVVRYRTMNVLARKKSHLSQRGVMPTVHFTALAATPAKEVIELFRPDHYGVVLVLDEQFKSCGLITETEVWEALPLKGISARIGEFLY
ncbi:MAG: M50 family metallopeptidase [Negativicutes bacterium]|nr:M50 family metallopeptidase [Negativicutes bacterium]